MTEQTKSYRTQWAAQFFAAAELTRRGHLVALTHGNAKQADLLVISPEGKHYRVDVKGLSAPNFWLIRHRAPEDDLYFILVHVKKNFGAPEYYILSSTKMFDEIEQFIALVKSKGHTPSTMDEGISFGQAEKYKDRWENLPDSIKGSPTTSSI